MNIRLCSIYCVSRTIGTNIYTHTYISSTLSALLRFTRTNFRDLLPFAINLPHTTPIYMYLLHALYIVRFLFQLFFPAIFTPRHKSLPILRKKLKLTSYATGECWWVVMFSAIPANIQDCAPPFGGGRFAATVSWIHWIQYQLGEAISNKFVEYTTSSVGVEKVLFASINLHVFIVGVFRDGGCIKRWKVPFEMCACSFRNREELWF